MQSSLIKQPVPQFGEDGYSYLLAIQQHDRDLRQGSRYGLRPRKVHFLQTSGCQQYNRAGG